jgi:hypothetical protein
VENLCSTTLGIVTEDFFPSSELMKYFVEKILKNESSEEIYSVLKILTKLHPTNVSPPMYYLPTKEQIFEIFSTPV